MDLDGKIRYKKDRVAPGIIISGPNKPKNLDSFFFPSFSHISALQHEGLPIWDADSKKTFISKIFIMYGTADGPGLSFHNGLTGHRGKRGCRLHCPLLGRHKDGCPTYYPALLKPNNYSVSGCDHPDVDIQQLSLSFVSADSIAAAYTVNLARLIQCTSPTEYNNVRRDSGIVKPSIILGLPRTLGVVAMNTLDFMHIPALNVPDLLVALWRGKVDCEAPDSKATWTWAVLTGNIWKCHGAQVAACTPYLPGSFDRPPRNPAEKISSGYKAWEYLLYIYGLGPALLYGVLPDEYWRNLCKLVKGVRLLLQSCITQSQLRSAHIALIEFTVEFESLYYQRKPERIHFVRQCIHALSHGAPETVRIGPAANFSQWTIERTIGNLGQEIRNHTNPFQNLIQRSIIRVQMNAIKAMVPELRGNAKLPRHAIDIGDGYLLLHPVDSCAREPEEDENTAIRRFWEAEIARGIPESHWPAQNIVRRARLHLPNGQLGRSRWKEPQDTVHIRISRNVKFLISPRSTRFGEVLYYFIHSHNGQCKNLAMIQPFSPPDESLLSASSNTLYVCQQEDRSRVVVVDVKQIQSVVAVIPFADDCMRPELRGFHYVVERPGNDIACIGGHDEDIHGE
ncbi:hypothetical protein AB1N83_011941 [Pleurotus pulmonarius]